MTLMKWQPVPLRGVQELKNEMDKIFEGFFGERMPSFREAAEFTPAVDVSETATDVVVKATVPGVDKKDINITITDNQLTIKGETRQEKEEKSKNYYRREISYGSFSRTVSLPAEVKGDQAKASMKDGMIEITIPKSEKAKTTEIKINVE